MKLFIFEIILLKTLIEYLAYLKREMELMDYDTALYETCS